MSPSGTDVAFPSASIQTNPSTLPAVYDGGLDHAGAVLSNPHHETEEVGRVVRNPVVRPRQVLHLPYESLLLPVLQHTGNVRVNKRYVQKDLPSPKNYVVRYRT